ncbi:MAG: SUMF1/EgtB/PvdO family nonheme iron enzyme [Candidatus Limimorpha sp.]
MKRKILFIIAATMLLSGCKKYIDYSAIKVEITNEKFVVTSTTATLTADYSWPGKVVSIAMEVSEDGGFANAMSFEATVSGNSLTVTATGLKAETKYYYRIITDTGSVTFESETKTFKTNNNLSFTVGGVSFEMVFVEGGSFDMGATTEQGSDAYDNEYPVHSVTLSGYYIGKCEVTQELWEAVMGSNPSNFKGAQNPVESVSWNDCQEFVSRLNSLTGRTFRLPTEAEWEYAARGGNKSRHYKYSGSNNIFDVAWHDGNSFKKTHAVGTKTANELGIYDMSGNVWEWCSDWYGGYSAGAQTNPQGPSSGSRRVLRGGGWNINARNCRVSNRNSYAPYDGSNDSGLRLVLVP